MDEIRASLSLLAGIHLRRGARMPARRATVPIAGKARYVEELSRFSVGWLVAGLDKMYPPVRREIPASLMAELWLMVVRKPDRLISSATAVATFSRWSELGRGRPSSSATSSPSASEIWIPVSALLGRGDHPHQPPLPTSPRPRKRLPPRALTDVPLSQSGEYHATPSQKRQYGDKFPGGRQPMD